MLRQYRDDEPLMSRIAATAGIVALVMLSVTILRMEVGYVFAAPSSSPSANPTEVPAEAANPTVWASAIAACMRSEQFIFVDPHTGADVAVFCNVEVLGKVGR